MTESWKCVYWMLERQVNAKLRRSPSEVCWLVLSYIPHNIPFILVDSPRFTRSVSQVWATDSFMFIITLNGSVSWVQIHINRGHGDWQRYTLTKERKMTLQPVGPGSVCSSFSVPNGRHVREATWTSRSCLVNVASEQGMSVLQLWYLIVLALYFLIHSFLQ